MNTFLGFIMGPMVWISALICIFGLLVKFILIIKEVYEKERYLLSYITVRHSLRSIIAWLIPFYPRSTRMRPVYYGISYLFHVLLFLLPVFLMSHIVLINESFNLSWPAMNDTAADILTIGVIFALVFFVLRRRFIPDVRFLTSFMDYILILMVLLPFVTGFLAYHQVILYKWIVIAHVLSGEVLLIVIPFSRFSHMITAPLTRAYTGSEFGNIRHARDW
ncbi:MAG: respiratory nitrate reductase subunit gamma [Proteobacteria bacterium]|nr:respiratory nitrate reductase subunit gamma [Desulfobacula sp.]MBU4133229.1 respiratory nitrate reductase subunit gamma [Pseudomonadota bacterium]